MAQIITQFIADDAITNAKIANNAVDSAQIATDAVIEAKIASDAVTTTKIAGDAVTTTKIAGDAVTGPKMRLANNQYLRARNAANSGDVNVIKLNASDVIEFASLPQATGTPSAANDLATKSYVDSVSGGAAGDIAKEAVHFVGDIANDPTTFGTGGTYDGYTPSVGDRFLYIGSHVSGQGIYEITGASTSARASDAAAIGDFAFGTSVWVLNGNVYSAQRFVQKDPAPAAFTDLDFVIENQNHKQSITLGAGDITNQYVDLAFKAKPNSVQLVVNGVVHSETDSYTLSVVSGVTRLTFAGDLATAGDAALVAGNVLKISFIKASY